MTVLFIVLAMTVILATALALAGRWQPQGLSGERPDTGPEHARFGVVLRGYRMDEVDAELARLHALLPAADAVDETDGER